ncbi:hypothetical protein [Paraburkholderia sp. BL25I1N1]|uniref:hypothetical protein n=1 Tax=Paraburkholderia sp. BL25I1N1 TaxID=1938804 RepID=UPI0011B25481|nr:hypothetical protein [Paraburkholderia sp. BL25I1N1]
MAAQAAEPPATKARAEVAPAKRVVLVTLNDPTILAVSIAAMANSILNDHMIADLPVDPVSAITILSPSGSRVLDAVKTFTSKDVEPQPKTVLIGHCNSFNPLCTEGAHILKEHLNPGACAVAYVEYKNLKRDEATGVLSHLNAAVEQTGAFVIIFVVCTKKQDTAWLRTYASEFVEVSKCEPGPGAQMAILLTNVFLTDRHAQGIGRVMVEAFVDSDGAYFYRSEPFIAERAIIRLAWCLRFKGAKMEPIAKLVGLNKSNVSRGLDNLLIPSSNEVGMKAPKGSRTRWATVYNLDELWPRKAPDACVAGNTAKAPGSSKTHDSGQTAKSASVTSAASPKTLP